MVKVLPPPKPDIPEPPSGQVWHVAPAGHYLWLEDPEYYDQMGRDPLQRARVWTITDSDQRAEKVGEVVKKYPKQKHRRNMLFGAARRGDTTLVRCLVQTGSRVHPDIATTQEKEDENSEEDGDESGSIPDKDDPAVTPVHVAASRGHLACVKIFIEEANVEVDVRDKFGRTPLVVAYDQPEIVRYLLEQGAEPMTRAIGNGDPATTPIRSYTGPNVLEHAASSGNLDVLKMLLDHPSFNSVKDWLTPSAIKNAARGGFESLKLLLERREYPMKDKNGTNKAELLSEEQKQNIIDATPIAADRGDLESLKLLLSYQSPIDDNGNFPPFDIPEDWRKPFIYGIFNAMVVNKPEKFEFLNSFGLKEHESMSLDKLPEGQNINTQRLLEKAVESGSIDCAKLMIKKYGADPNRHRIPPGLQPVFIGALRDKTEMLQYLLDNYDIDIHLGNGRYSSGPTALWGAINLKSLGSIAILLQHGGPVDRIDEELRNIEGPSTAILRGTWPLPGSGPMVFLETEEHTQEYLEWARHNWQNLNPRYVRLELCPEDKEWLNALQLRKNNKELRETGEAARELNEQEGADENSLSNRLRDLMPPAPTFKDREAELKNDDDLIPEFKPFAIATGFTDRLAGNPEVY
ncbi:ankyrin repeat-containing domain protein [Xylaria acuta]|nr:ankyrin repeat-containing domain protein [Xylaria acuta]